MTQYTMKLSFDLRQVTQSLEYEFVLPNNSNHELTKTGPLAGTFNFKEGDEIFVEVVGSSAENTNGEKAKPKDILTDFRVTNCTFVSVPSHMKECLSLFDKHSACSSFDNPKEWSKIQKVSLPNNTQQLSRRSLKSLTIVIKNGQWQISGYLSVLLTPAEGEPYSQVYFFDPEGSTGNGGGWSKSGGGR